MLFIRVIQSLFEIVFQKGFGIMDKDNRRAWKTAGRKVFHRNYLLLVFLCLLLSFFGTEGGRSVSLFKSKEPVPSESEQTQTPSSILNASDVYNEIVSGDFIEGTQVSDEILENIEASSKDNKILGRTNGVMAGMINSFASGKLYLRIAKSLRSLTKTDEGAAILFLVLDMLRIALVWIFLQNVYSAILRRTFLELRIYDRYPFLNLLHFAEIRRWFKASWTMAVKDLFLLLWSFTIIGGFIKYYSYFAVPYIVAENPGIGTLEAITLSRKMMNGHKKEAFLFDLSYIGWILLSCVTIGLSDLFYGLPYRIAGRTEYYVWLRTLAKQQQIPSSEKLDDTYLFEKADKLLLYDTYFDVVDKQVYIHDNRITLSRVKQFASKWFGLWLGTLDKKKSYEELEEIKYQIYQDTKRRDGESYPSRLNPRYHKAKFKLQVPFTFLRSYSVWTLILLFILFSAIGWGWEVSLHLMNGDGFINRGMMHGPWIPIYGTGGIIALMLCSRFRKHPVQEFFFSVALCGAIEYLGAYMLETRYHERWWSYDGNFLNLHGRICAEGLLVFGIACMLVVYLIAPLFDYVLSYLKKQILITIAVVLIGVFAIDLVYSTQHPNMVKGAIESHEENDGQSTESVENEAA